MENEQNWYRQLAALVLLSSARAAVEYLTNPSSRDNAGRQLKESFAAIDYEALASALTDAIDRAADTSKNRLADTIDTIRDRGVDAVEEAKGKAESKLGQKKGGGKLKFLFVMAIGGVIAWLIIDEQKRDELMDRLTGASGPIQQGYQPPSPPPSPAKPAATSQPKPAATQPSDQVTEAIKTPVEKTEKSAEKSTAADKPQS